MNSGRRVLQLDALRAVAVILVICHHWTQLGQSMGLGNIGVQLFFVLSGFLITGILLKCRDRYERGQRSLGSELQDFFLRRTTRIWPIYFLTLFGVFLLGVRFETRSGLVWHAVFASNLLFFHRGEFNSALAHFWSLAVEQQFYLIWPLIVMLLPSRFMEILVLCLIALAPISRILLFEVGYLHFAEYNVLPFANFDSLGLGALIAMWSRLPTEEAKFRRMVLSWSAGGAVLLFVFTRIFGSFLPADPEQTIFAVIFAWVILRASMGITGVIGRVLEWRPLIWLGIISYGVYVYHMFAPRIVGAGFRIVSVPTEWQVGPPLLFGSVVLTLFVATLSWFIIERPLLNRRHTPIVAEARGISRSIVERGELH